MADVSNLRANINGVFETFGVKDKIARENAENLSNALFAAQIVNSASGAIASFPDGADDIPVRSLSVDLEPIQDLHGYDHPWPAGGGKNLFDASVLTEQAEWKIVKLSLPPGTYTMSTSKPANNLPLYFRLSSDSTLGSTTNVNDTHPVTRTIPDGDTAEVVFRRVSGDDVFSNYWFQIEDGTSATSYAPYENLCPISGRDSATVVRMGKNLFDDDDFALANFRLVTDPEDEAYGYYFGLARNLGYNASSPFSKDNGGLVRKSPIDGTVAVSFDVARIDSRGYVRFYYEDGTNSGNVFSIESETVGHFSCRSNPAKSVSAVNFMTVGGAASKIAIKNLQIERSNTETAYEPYDGQSATIQLGQTVYGGTVDVTTGVMTVDRAIKTVSAISVVSSSYIKSDATDGYIRFEGEIYPSINAMLQPNDLCADSFAFKAKAIWSATGYANCWTVNLSQIHINIANDLLGITDYTQETTETAKAKLNAYLAEHPVTLTIPIQPTVIDLTPAQITSLLGNNNVWSDADSVTVDYVADPKLYIDKKIAEALSP